MSTGRGSRNNVLAGVFVIVAAALFVAIVVVMSNLGDFFTAQATYIVRFTVADGVEGLDRGAQVKIGGQRVGKVTKLAPVNDPKTDEPLYIDVEIQIPAKLKVYSDAQVQLVKPLLGTGATINIVSLSGAYGADEDGPQGPAHLLHPGDTVVGVPGPPGYLAPADYAKLQSILTRTDSIMRQAEPKIGSIMANADATVADVRRIADDVNAKWPTWSRQASDVIDRVDKASREFDTIVESVRTVATSVREGVSKAGELIDKGRAVIDENRKRFDEIVENIRSVTHKADTEWAAKVTAVMDDAKATLESARDAAKEARDLLARNGPELDDVMTNAALAARQLKLATVEIRASPWRLLYQPTKKELENELLYNSVRQYSEAVGELKSAADSLRAVTQRAGAGGAPVDQKSLDSMTTKLRATFDKYQEREKAFMDRWMKEGK